MKRNRKLYVERKQDFFRVLPLFSSSFFLLLSTKILHWKEREENDKRNRDEKFSSRMMVKRKERKREKGDEKGWNKVIGSRRKEEKEKKLDDKRKKIIRDKERKGMKVLSCHHHLLYMKIFLPILSGFYFFIFFLLPPFIFFLLPSFIFFLLPSTSCVPSNSNPLQN